MSFVLIFIELFIVKVHFVVAVFILTIIQPFSLLFYSLSILQFFSQLYHYSIL
ncbi:hypothetical protein BDF19DRAFT_440648 [Syncephalis fuscata]|nr:hypothetical protein BDF19DRAFT_440648 [Syncephalis fuscata]